MFVAAEVGRVLDPVNFENQVQGAVIWGLGHAMNAELTYADGVAEQTNFHLFETMRMKQVPEIVVRAIEGGPKVRASASRRCRRPRRRWRMQSSPPPERVFASCQCGRRCGSSEIAARDARRAQRRDARINISPSCGGTSHSAPVRVITTISSGESVFVPSPQVVLPPGSAHA